MLGANGLTRSVRPEVGTAAPRPAVSPDGGRSLRAARRLGVSADREVVTGQEVWVESAEGESEQGHRGDDTEHRPPLAVGKGVVAEERDPQQGPREVGAACEV